jgi:hypothetical protein
MLITINRDEIDELKAKGAGGGGGGGGDAIVPKVDGKEELAELGCAEENSGHLAWYRDVNNGDAKLMMCTPDGFGWWTLV